MSQVTKGELQRAARNRGIDPDQSYESLREAVEIKTCKHCRDEYAVGWSDQFCTDGCEAEYINEHFR